jgi:hypothetical protein
LRPLTQLSKINKDNAAKPEIDPYAGGLEGGVPPSNGGSGGLDPQIKGFPKTINPKLGTPSAYSYPINQRHLTAMAVMATEQLLSFLAPPQDSPHSQFPHVAPQYAGQSQPQPLGTFTTARIPLPKAIENMG